MLSFVKVVELGGFASAARQLNLANSVVTDHVKSLEERLGARLLNRTTRSISLTGAGQAYYERCVQILSEIEDAEDTVQTLQSRPRGILRVNSSPAAPPVLAPSIAEYNNLYPEVTVRLTTTSRMPDLVEQGFDLAIRYSTVPDSSLIVRRLASFWTVLCASPQYLAKWGEPKHPSDLAKHSCVTYYDAAPYGKDGKEWKFSGPDGDFSVEVSGPLETNNPEVLRGAALRDQGFILVPMHLVIEELRSGALVAVLTEFLPGKFPIDAFYPNREHLPAKVRTFIDLVAKNFRQIDWNPCLRDDKRCNSSPKQAIQFTESPAAARAPKSGIRQKREIASY
jgi:DNA-binding transcriptional LysR family regulator